MAEIWRLLDTGVGSAALNMALDEAILEARSQNLIPNTLRFLQFSPPCVLVGYHQAVEQEVRTEFCRQQGIEINRRLTGGGALFWDESQVGWEIYALDDRPALLGRPEHLYIRLIEGAIRGLAKLGVQAAFRPKNDIEVGGRKISGTGGTALDGAFLFQGTLLVDFDVETMLRALRIPIEKLKDKELASVRQRVTCLAWELGEVPPLDTIKAALAQGFSEALHAEFVPEPLTTAEEALLANRLPGFRSEEWIFGIRRPPATHQELRALYKARGGLIRASLVVDGAAGRIRQALLTGDFFAYPQRAIFDLEARLKDAPAELEAVGRIVEEFFAEGRAIVPGVAPADFVRAIGEALRKRAFTARFEVSAAEANNLFTVGRPLEEMERPGALLLPYCAKLPECSLRYSNGCDRCGLCSVGQAYSLAERHGLIPITIQNYEMLEEELAGLQRGGVRAFVGSCCEAFYVKHCADFERIGLPGILVGVDSSTCYDLGQEEKAYRGEYKGQTKLNLKLLEQVVEHLIHDGR